MGKATKKYPQGWMNGRGRRFLRKRGKALPEDGLAVEVGSWKGRSTLAITRRMTAGARLYAVDTWAGVPDDPEQHDRLYADTADPYVEFRINLGLQIAAGRVIPLRLDSLQGAAQIAHLHGGRSLDFVFIDADHRYEAVRADILAYLPLLKPGGILAGHDFGENYPGVVQAVNELVPGFKVYKDSLIWWVRVAERGASIRFADALAEKHARDAGLDAGAFVDIQPTGPDGTFTIEDVLAAIAVWS